ncbi:MAG TPA: nucleoside deaminase [Bacteroidetes bacterium]|nr:nucleoside deaminase [Bacteroidota bacterium]
MDAPRDARGGGRQAGGARHAAPAVGAVVVRDGQIVGKGHNQVERLGDPTAHAEMLAISAACSTLGTKYLDGCTLYVTLEPCPMCAGAIVWAKLSRLVYGAFDEKAGAASTLYDIPQDGRLNHRVETVSGVMAEESADLLRQFFLARRTPGGDGAPR